MSRPKGPEKEKMGINVRPSTKDWIRVKALERYGSLYAMGRVVEDLVEAFVGSEDAVREWHERAKRMEQARDDIQRVAAGLARERDSLRRQLAEQRARKRAARARF